MTAAAGMQHTLRRGVHLSLWLLNIRLDPIYRRKWAMSIVSMESNCSEVSVPGAAAVQIFEGVSSLLYLTAKQ